MNKRNFALVSLILLFSFISFSFFKKPTGYLTFSDSAKFADVARSINNGSGFISHHSFFDESILKFHINDDGWGLNSYPATPILYSVVFRIFGESDGVLIITGGTLFMLTGIALFALSKKISEIVVSYVSLILYAFNPFILEYSYNATSEIFLMFLMVFGTHFFVAKGRLKIAALFALLLTLATRQQGILILVVLFGYFLYRVLNKYGKVGLITTLVLGTVFYVVFLKTICKYDTCPFSISRVLGPVWQNNETSPGIFLRGAVSIVPQLNVQGLASKTAYNFYNFLKNTDRLAPSIVWGFFLIGVFISFKKEKRWGSGIVYFTASLLVLFLIAASATLPNARYVHPILPLIFIFSALGIVNSVNSKIVMVVLVSFTIFPVLGDIFIDYRFRSNIYNFGQPPAYKIISEVVSTEVNSRDLIITNMDAWMSWYGKLRTMWFPLSPKQLQGYDPKYIVLTSYNIEDGDFALGNWKEVLDNNETVSDEYLLQTYKTFKKFEIPPEDVYEKKKYSVVILKRR